MKINKLIKHYGEANVVLSNIYELKIKRGSIDENTTTLRKHCGILVPIQGKALYKVEDRPYFLEKGTVLHAGPSMGLSKFVGLEEDWHYYLIHYDILGSPEAKAFLESYDYSVTVNESIHDQLGSLCRELLSYYQQSNMVNGIKEKFLLYKIFDILVQAKRDNRMMTETQKINYVKEYMQSHIHETLSVLNLAELVEMSLKRFTYLFTKVNGVSPKKYMSQIKVKKAEELLLRTDKGVLEIALDIGYHDVFYFSRFFKKHTGYSPSDFKKLLGKSPC